MCVWGGRGGGVLIMSMLKGKEKRKREREKMFVLYQALRTGSIDRGATEVLYVTSLGECSRGRPETQPQPVTERAIIKQRGR